MAFPDVHPFSPDSCYVPAVRRFAVGLSTNG